MFSDVAEMDEIARDREVIAAATPAPRTVDYTDDDVAMNAIRIVRKSGVGDLRDHENNVAVVLLQTPRYCVVGDGKWDENAEFIVRARRRWPAAVERISELEQRVAQLERQLADTGRAK